MKKIVSLLLAVALLLSVPTAVFAAEETQTITIEMKDSYGDGWDNFKLKVCLVNADETETVLEQSITISSGSTNTYSVTVAKDARVRIYCQNVGSYSSEHSFVVKREGITIFSHEQSDTPTSDQLFVTSDPINVRGSVITHDIDPTYTVTIPATVTLGETASISAENVVLAHGEYVEVTLSATSGENNAFTLQNEVGNVITYTVTAGGTQVSLGDSVLAVYPGANPSGSTELAFALPQDLKYPGNYTGTVTFTIAVNTAVQTQ